MKRILISTISAVSMLTFAVAVQAHEPEKHNQEAKKPDCTAMKDMDHSKMDMTDPVMMAMMQQCMSEMTHGDAAGGAHAAADADADADADAGHDAHGAPDIPVGQATQTPEPVDHSQH